MRVSDVSLTAALEPSSPEWRSVAGLEDAAVMALLVDRAGEDHLVYTLRRDDLPSHAGEISFPGGGREGDEDAVTCARREVREEIGVRADALDVLGRLGERRSSASFCVHCYVARLAPTAVIVPNPAEVAAIIEIPLAELCDAARWRFRGDHSVPFFFHEGRTLWGLTGRLTLDLVGKL